VRRRRGGDRAGDPPTREAWASAPPRRELSDLHIHLGGAVAARVLWSIAHDQGFELPVSDHWELEELVSARPGKVNSLDEHLRSEVRLLRQGGVLSDEQIDRALRWAREATFVDGAGP
jgi:adenosine deaminase